MGMFDDYVNTQLNAREIQMQKKREMEMAEHAKAKAEMDVQKNLLPLIIDALEEIPGAIKQLGCPSVKYYEEYTTGRILKRTEIRTTDAWVFCNQWFSITFSVPEVKGAPSQVAVTDDGRFVYPRENCGAWENVRNPGWELREEVYGPIVPIETAAEAIMGEMLQSAENWRGARGGWDRRKAELIQIIKKYEQLSYDPSVVCKKEKGQLQSIDNFFRSHDWPVLLKQGDYQAAVKKYMLFSLSWMQDNVFVKWIRNARS